MTIVQVGSFTRMSNRDWRKNKNLENIILFTGDICISDIEKIKAKTLIIHGLKDPLVPLEHPDYLHHNIKGSR